MNYILAFTASLLLSLSFTGLCLYFGKKYNIVSIPRQRDVHKKPVPRIGGLGIFLAFFVTTLFSFLIAFPGLKISGGRLTNFDEHFWGIMIASVVIVSIMLIDDIKGLKAWQKFLAQSLVALIVIASGIGIDTLSNPFGEAFNLNSVYIKLFTLNGTVYHFSLFSDLLTYFWIVGMMNILNFVDGVDGLAGGLSVIAAFVIFLLSISFGANQMGIALLSIILVGSTMGFLVFNFPPAKIFMGDSGSMFLGFMLGVLPLISGGKLATVFLVLGFPIVDGVFVVISRLLKGKNPMTAPDKTHLHHRFLKAGFTQRQSILSLYFISALFGWVALRSSTLNKMIASVALVSSLFILIYYLDKISKRRVSGR